MYFCIILEKKPEKERVSEMVKYEIKKVFSQTGGKIALFLLMGLLALSCYFAFDISYVNRDGSSIHGPVAAQRLREEKHEWAGVVDAELLRRVLEENRRILAMPEAQIESLVENNITYSRRQGFSDLRDLLNHLYADGFRSYNYYLADGLVPEQVTEDFYENRARQLREWLEEEGGYAYTDEEEAYLIKQYENWDIPLRYDYAGGWTQLFQYMAMIIMVTVYVLGYLTANIFSCEFGLKADSIFFSSAYGRNRAVRAKIEAGVCIVTIIYWGMVLLFSAIVLISLGADGADCQIQSYFEGWKSLYNVTNLQTYLLIVTGGYIGSMFMCLLTMFVSAKTKSAVVAVMVPLVLTFMPSFLGGSKAVLINKFLGLWPDRLLDIYQELSNFHLYQMGGTVVRSVPVLLILYGILTVVLVPIIYVVYKRKQIG